MGVLIGKASAHQVGHAVIDGVTVDHYQKTGIEVDGAGSTATVTNSTVIGAGPQGQIAQNGIQVSRGGTATITGNTVTGSDFTRVVDPTDPQADYAAGVLLYAAGAGTVVAGNTLTNDQIGVESVASSATIGGANPSDGNAIAETAAIADSVGIFAVPCDMWCDAVLQATSGSSTLTIQHNTISGIPQSDDGSSPPVISAGIWVGASPVQGSLGTTTATVSDNSVAGGYYGIEFGPSTRGTISENTVSAFQRDGITVGGFLIGGAGASATVSGNTVTGPGSGNKDPWATNGIEVANGATATVSGNHIAGLVYTGASQTEASAVTVYESSNVAVQGNRITDSLVAVAVQAGGYSADQANWTMTGDTVSDNTIAYTSAYLSSGPRAGEQQTWGVWVASYGVKASVNAAVTGNTINGLGSGPNGIPSTGVEVGDTAAGGAAGAVSANVTGNSITGWRTGIDAASTTGVAFALDPTWNDLSGNSTGLDNASGAEVVATDNWWGCAAGSGPGCSAVAGTATTSPWLQALTVTPAQIVAAPGQAVTVTATLRDSASAAVAPAVDLPVAFSTVAGNCVPSSGTVAMVTHGSGTVPFTCTASTGGTLTIHAAMAFAGQPSTLASTTSGAIALPAVTGISPATGLAAGGTTVSVTGSGFTVASAVYFGSTPAPSVSFINGGSLTAVSPAGRGTVDITVRTSAGGSVATTADQFTYGSAPPSTAPGLSVVASPSSPTTDQVVSITATVTDGGTTPQTVTFQTDQGHLLQHSVQTDPNGRATVLLYAPGPQTDHVTATVGTLSATVTVPFTQAQTISVTGSVYDNHQPTVLPVGQMVPLQPTVTGDTVTMSAYPLNSGTQSLASLSLTLNTGSGNATAVSQSVYASVYDTGTATSLLSTLGGITLSVATPTHVGGGATFVGPVVNFQTSGKAHELFGNDTHTTSNPGIQVTLPYNPASVAPGQTPSIFWFDATTGRWTNAGITILAVGPDTVTALLPHLSLYPVIALAETSATTESVTASESTVQVGGQTTITALVLDQNGRPMSGVPVSFQTSAGSLGVSGAPTGSNGEATTTLTAPTTPGSVSVSAVVVGIAANPVGVTVTVGPGAQLTLVLSGTTVPLNGTVTVSGTATDSQGNPEGNATIDLRATGGRVPAAVMTAVDGTYTATFTATQVGAGTVTATIDGTTVHETQALTVQGFSGPTGGGGGGGGGLILPSPAAAPSNSVGYAGGELQTQDGSFAMHLAVGAVLGTGSLTLTEGTPPTTALPPGTVAASSAFTLSGASLSGPQRATIKYNAAALKGLSAHRLSVYQQQFDGTWRFVPTMVNADGTVSVNVSGPGTLVVLATTQTFTDVPTTYWAAAGIDSLVAAGLVDGFPDGTFQPDAGLTRAQMVKMLVLTLGLTPGGTQVPFTDVPADAWYAPYVWAATQSGLVEGTTATTFSPEAPVTREELAVLLSRASKLGGTTSLAFSDTAQIAPWAMTGVEAAVQAGYLQGFPNGTFQPTGQATRAQAATVLAQVLAHMAG